MGDINMSPNRIGKVENFMNEKEGVKPTRTKPRCKNLVCYEEFNWKTFCAKFSVEVGFKDLVNQYDLLYEYELLKDCCHCLNLTEEDIKHIVDSHITKPVWTNSKPMWKISKPVWTFSKPMSTISKPLWTTTNKPVWTPPA